MSNYNKVLLMGRLTRDPELRYTPQGTPVAEIGIATNREFLVGTERRKDTTFVDVTLWRRQAEVVCQYLKKGAPIFIEGHLSFDTWETQDGQKRSRLRVIADNFQFLGGRQEGDSSRGSSGEEFSQQGEGEGGGYSSSSARRPFPTRAAESGVPAKAGEASPSSRFPRPAGNRVPNEAFSPVPENDGSGPEEGGSESPIGGVDDRDIPF